MRDPATPSVPVARPRPSEAGFSLLEIALSISILAIALMGLMYAMTTAVQAERAADEMKIARQWASSTMERIRAMGFGDINENWPQGFAIDSTWSNTDDLGLTSDFDNDGDDDFFGIAYYANSGKTYNGTSLDDALLLGLQPIDRASSETAYQRIGEVLIIKVDSAMADITDSGGSVIWDFDSEGLDEEDGYRVIVRVNWKTSQGQEATYKLVSFITRK